MLVSTLYLRIWRSRISRFWKSEPGQRLIRGAGWFFGGFFLSAGAMLGDFQTLSLGFVCAAPGLRSGLLAALGSWIGYRYFWGSGAMQAGVWMVLGAVTAALMGKRDLARRQVLLTPALAAVIAAGSGVFWLIRFGDTTPIGVYVVRVLLALGSGTVFRLWLHRRGTWADWIAQGFFVLALAQVVPVRYLGLGYVAAGFLGASGGFPAAVLAGLGLDLAMVTPVKMTGVLCLGFCLRLVPQPKWGAMLAPALAYGPVAFLSGVWDVHPVPGLILGGVLSVVLPGAGKPPVQARRRGETALMQMRLEQMSGVLRQMEQSLLLAPEPRLDAPAVLERALRAACELCPERRNCRARPNVSALPVEILEQPGLGEAELPRGCRKTGRLLLELRRGQEQLRRMKGDRNRLSAYRTATREQYGFLADYLQELSEEMTRRPGSRPARFRVEIGMSTHSLREENGDLCQWFAGMGNQYYVLLCDGMGTGIGAAQESRETVALLRQMLTAGFPAEYALRSLNSAAVLRQMGGCATIDLMQLSLDTGRGNLYKWGAAPSYLLKGGQIKKIGTAGPPPGLSQQSRETVDRLSLDRGEMLVLLSDGAGEGGLLRSGWTAPEGHPGEIAAAILEQSGADGDDATAVVVRLIPDAMAKT